jgi:hypothetical protein
VQFLSLYCVRGQPDVLTRVLPGHRVDQAFALKDRLAFREHQFVFSDLLIPESGQRRRPLLFDTQRGAGVAFGEVYMKDNPDSYTVTSLQKMLTKIDELAPQATAHELQTGDVMFIDNNGLHRRMAFEPRWPFPRWQMRTFVGTPNTPLFVDPTRSYTE